MKKLLVALGILGFLGLVAAIGYVALFMEEPTKPTAATSSASAPEEGKSPALDVKKQAKTDADILEALDYEIQKNPDTVGWIKIPGTEINNSVVQGHDNTAYLRRNERRQEDIYGCYFADYECSIGDRQTLSPNTVVYGHSDLQDNPDGPRFSQLFRFTDETFAAHTPVIEFASFEEFMNWQVFAVFFTDVGFDYIRAAPEPAAFEQMIAKARALSIYDYAVPVTAQDKILTLSTCTIKFGPEDNSHRLVVMAKLLPDGEEPPTTAELTAKNAEE